MYMAQMFCYGMDYQRVGITGIVGCIGCVYVGVNALYAVHIPHQALAKQKMGAEKFAQFVLGGWDNDMGTRGELHVFVNGRNRDGAADEARALRSTLNQPVTKVYRIMTNLGPKSGGHEADAVTVLVERVASSLTITYKHVPPEGWEPGGGGKSGCYQEVYEGTFGSAVKPKASELASGWNTVDLTTCSILGIK